MRLFILLLLFVLLLFLPLCSLAGEGAWPGLPPDCWFESRFYHSSDQAYPWKENTVIKAINGIKPEAGERSPNKGYLFIAQGGRPRGRIIIYAEKDHLIEVSFAKLYGLTDVKWINEKLLFMRPWWGRIAATDIIYDVENEQVVYAESVTDGSIARQQFQQSCSTLGGCQCIKKQ